MKTRCRAAVPRCRFSRGPPREVKYATGASVVPTAVGGAVSTPPGCLGNACTGAVQSPKGSGQDAETRRSCNRTSEAATAPECPRPSSMGSIGFLGAQKRDSGARNSATLRRAVPHLLRVESSLIRPSCSSLLGRRPGLGAALLGPQAPASNFGPRPLLSDRGNSPQSAQPGGSAQSERWSSELSGRCSPCC